MGVISTHCLVLVTRCPFQPMFLCFSYLRFTPTQGGEKRATWNAKVTTVSARSKYKPKHRHKAQRRPSQNGLKTVPKEVSCELEIAAQEAKTRERHEETGAEQPSLCSHSRAPLLYSCFCSRDRSFGRFLRLSSQMTLEMNEKTKKAKKDARKGERGKWKRNGEPKEDKVR